jgi:hypothetical protein
LGTVNDELPAEVVVLEGELVPESARTLIVAVITELFTVRPCEVVSAVSKFEPAAFWTVKAPVEFSAFSTCTGEVTTPSKRTAPDPP